VQPRKADPRHAANRKDIFPALYAEKRLIKVSAVMTSGAPIAAMMATDS
jgi:hypothetical protein